MNASANPFSFPIAVLVIVAWASLGASASVIRSNGKGGGPWSSPDTWAGGKVPTNGSVTVLENDIVDLDSTGPSALECDDLVIDPKGILRVTGQDQASVTFTIHNSIRVFGGMIVDYSGAPHGKCEFVWETTEPVRPELQLNDGCKVSWKGAPGSGSPNVIFRMPLQKAARRKPPARPVTLVVASHVWVECERVAMQGFDVSVTGVDGTGLKYNETCRFRDCEFDDSSVTFRSCTKIEFEGNRMEGSPQFGLRLLRTTHARIAGNVIDRTSASLAAIAITASSDCEIVSNTVRQSRMGFNTTSSNGIFFRGNRIEHNRIGMMVNSCGRIVAERCVFSANEQLDLRATYERPVEPWRFYDCVFDKPPTHVGGANVSVEGVVAVEMINCPPLTYQARDSRESLTFSAYLDVLVVNDRREPLGRVPIRVSDGKQVMAASRTEAVGEHAGHTPLPSSHRPLIVPWFRFSATEGTNPPPQSIAYQIEADGTALGYESKTEPLVMDASFIRADPDKPTKTVTVTLAVKK